MAVDDSGGSGRKRKKSVAAEGVENEEEEEEEREEETEGDDEEEEREEETEGEEGGDFVTSNGSQIVRIEPDFLDCPVCSEAFRPPIYQCQNGHVVCSPCCSSLCGKCHVCAQPISLIRCLALENVMESVQIRCRNARYGCDATFSYSHQATHLEICNYRQCTCPISSCTFKGCTRGVSHHFLRHHRNSAKEFRYDCCFEVVVYPTVDPFLVLLGPDGGLFLLLNNTDTTRGSALSMICISSRSEKANFEYELSVGDYPTTQRLETPIESTIEWKGVYPTNIFLFVPKDFHPPNKIVVHVTIYKC